jgi:TIR domain-containing protein/tetratricopeptide repeat protein
VADGEDRPEPGLDFYISYAGRDRLWAEWIGGTLMGAGYTVELDVWNWHPGDNVILAREAALRRAGRVLALCSAAYFGGGFPEQDWTAVMAAQHGQPGRLVPVWIEDLDGRKLPGLLRSVQPIKLFGLSGAEAGKRLLAGLAGDLGPDGMPPFFGPAGQKGPEEIAATGPRLPGQHQPACWHVPPRNPDFSGRDGLLVQVRERLPSASQGMVILQGPGGVGKTQLSIEYAHRFAADYDTVWAIDSEQPELITSQLADLAVAMGAATAVADAQTAGAAALAALRDRGRWLLMFDNVEDPDHLTSLLPGGQGHVLVTTRAGRWQEIGPLIVVEEFSRPESTAMLTARVAALTLTDADRIASALGDLPLALAQAAGVLQSGLPAAEFQRMLAGQATLILSQGKPRSYPTTLAAATLIALDKLAAAAPEAANLLRLCGYLAPESIPATLFSRPAAYAAIPGAAEVIPLPGEVLEIVQAYGQIRDIGLGRVDQNGLRLHRLTQAVLRDHTADHQAAYHEVVSAVLAAAAPPDSDDPVNWPEWSRLVPHVLAVAPENAPASFRPLACGAARYLLVSGQAKAALTLTTRLHETWTAALGPDDADTLTAAQHLAHATHDTGDYATALEIHQDTLARRRRVLTEDHPDTLHSANDLAVSLSSMGRDAEALALNQDTYDRRRRVLGEDHPDTVALRTTSPPASQVSASGKPRCGSRASSRSHGPSDRSPRSGKSGNRARGGRITGRRGPGRTRRRRRRRRRPLRRGRAGCRSPGRAVRGRGCSR